MQPREGPGRREDDERREADQIQLERTRPTWGTVATLIMVVITALVTYAATNNSVDRRLSVAETKQAGAEQRMNEINGRLEQLNLKMDQILLNYRTDSPR